MYVSLVALSLHYAIPCYHQLATKIRSHELIQWSQRLQLEMNEYLLLRGELPSEWELSSEPPACVSDYEWDGQEFHLLFTESGSHSGTLTLSPHLDSYDLQWDCDYDGSAAMKTYLCYALSR